MDRRKNMVFLDGKERTAEIKTCELGEKKDRYYVSFKNFPEKIYSFGRSRVEFLTCSKTINPRFAHVIYRGRRLVSVGYIAVFSGATRCFYYIEYENGRSSCFNEDEIQVIESCLTKKSAIAVFDYLSEVAKSNSLKKEGETVSMLAELYRGVDIIGKNLAAAPYLNPDAVALKTLKSPDLIFPFACNTSQLKAIQRAFENQISVIQGPPGTGKTQTILNITANLVYRGKSVLIVSNNNSAVENIVEKLNRHEMGFLCALLGSRENRTRFIESQENGLSIPKDIGKWKGTEENASRLNRIGEYVAKLRFVFADQERLAVLRQELRETETEQIHFLKNCEAEIRGAFRRALSPSRLLELWCALRFYSGKDEPPGFFSKLIFALRKWFFRRVFFRLLEDVTDGNHGDLHDFIHLVQREFYRQKIRELRGEVDDLEKKLSLVDSDGLLRCLNEESMHVFKRELYQRFGGLKPRKVLTRNQLKGKNLIDAHPVVLSTTFSARTVFDPAYVFDYVIMDEASQISVETGMLALSCAQNAVIVGDTMQLSNVVTEKDRQILSEIKKRFGIDGRYDCAEISFLESVCRVFPAVSQTLLREHYRCHPKIINFCNQKFYGGQLIIMTKDNGEPGVLSAKRTVVGNHERDRINQREADVIAKEVLPGMPFLKEDIGIIAPYNRQVELLSRQLSEYADIATVHKFQGREKNAIIMSIVDDTVTAFSDDPNLMNVAISRAKNKFCLVVSGNNQPRGTNVCDLLEYIRYNNCEVSSSKIRSVFDLLYTQYREVRERFLKKEMRISEFDSENLTYALLQRIIKGNQSFRHLGVLCHYPLRQLIYDRSLLKIEDLRYVLNPGTHIDFLLYNRVSKQAVLAVETDGYKFHRQGSAQEMRDRRKNRILALYEIPVVRLSTNGSRERERITEALLNCVKVAGVGLLG